MAGSGKLFKTAPSYYYFFLSSGIRRWRQSRQLAEPRVCNPTDSIENGAVVRCDAMVAEPCYELVLCYSSLLATLFTYVVLACFSAFTVVFNCEKQHGVGSRRKILSSNY
jgi:hypothetical protein